MPYQVLPPSIDTRPGLPPVKIFWSLFGSTRIWLKYIGRSSQPLICFQVLPPSSERKTPLPFGSAAAVAPPRPPPPPPPRPAPPVHSGSVPAGQLPPPVSPPPPRPARPNRLCCVSVPALNAVRICSALTMPAEIAPRICSGVTLPLPNPARICSGVMPAGGGAVAVAPPRPAVFSGPPSLSVPPPVPALAPASTCA